MKYVVNAFSFQMIRDPNCLLAVHELEQEEFEKLTEGVLSMVGHEDLANVLGVKYNRENIVLNKGDTLYVAQVMGGRLPEGTTELPAGFSLKFYCMKIIESLIVNNECAEAIT